MWLLCRCSNGAVARPLGRAWKPSAIRPPLTVGLLPRIVTNSRPGALPAPKPARPDAETRAANAPNPLINARRRARPLLADLRGRSLLDRVHFVAGRTSRAAGRRR